MINTSERIQWVTAAPLWADLASTRQAGRLGQFRQPALLRFATDTFMDDFNATLQTAPLQVTALRAKPETWKGPVPAPILPTKSLQQAVQLRKTRGAFSPRQALEISHALASATPPPQATPVPFDLKLYQPAHQRYYLVTGCLVCRTPGLPDRKLDPGAGERVSFVVRRLSAKSTTVKLNSADPATFDEFAFVEQNGAKGWQRTTDALAVSPDEERLPLFPLTYSEMDGRKRRVLGGLVPVARREAYVHATELNANGTIRAIANPVQPTDPREVQLLVQVTEPWKELVTRAERTWGVIKDPTNPDFDAGEAAKLNNSTRTDIQGISWLLVLDLAKWLSGRTPQVWNAVESNSGAGLAGRALTAFNAIQAIKVSPALLTAVGSAGTPEMRLDEALRRIATFERGLEGAEKGFGGNLGGSFPDFRFPLADPHTHDSGNPGILPLLSSDKALETGETEFQRERNGLDEFAAKLVAALPAPTTTLPPLPLTAQPVMASNEAAWFVIRMVFECPACGALKPAVVSEPTEPFQMASYYDPDAPARPIRIAMPMDTSPAGLRKFDKNTVFMMSDILCGQVSKAKGLGLGDLVLSVLPFPFHKDLDADSPVCDMGMMCSVSIPIITICAFILLMVMVSLLDLIFHWMPFFILCFPVPNFKGKAAVSIGT